MEFGFQSVHDKYIDTNNLLEDGRSSIERQFLAPLPKYGPNKLAKQKKDWVHENCAEN